MKRTMFIYLALLLASLGLSAIDRQWGGLLLVGTMLAWFLHAVFSSTGDSPRA